MKTYILLFPVSLYDRKTDVESFEGEIFASLESLKEFIITNSVNKKYPIKIVDISEFTSMYNDEDLDYHESWISFVNVKN